MVAHAITGHKRSSPDLNMCTCTSLLSFFWNSKRILTKSASFRFGSSWFRILFSFLKMIFPTLTIFVLFYSSDAVLRYSQDLMAKNVAPISNQVTALSLSDVANSIIFLRTIIGRAFCFRLVPSLLR